MTETKEVSPTNKTSYSVDIVGFIGLLFIILKVFGEYIHTPIATLSWVWVLSPFWLPFVFMIAVSLIVIVLFGIILIVCYIFDIPL